LDDGVKRKEGSGGWDFMALLGMPADGVWRGELHHVSIGAGAGVQMKTHHDSSVCRRRHLMVTARLQYFG